MENTTTNIEKLTARLNACKHRRAIYNVLMSCASLTSLDNPHEALLKAVKEGESEHE